MPERDADTRRLKDFAGAVVLLLLQGFCWRAAMLLTHGQMHGAGPVLRYGGFALLMVTLVLVVVRIVRMRPAAWLALGGLGLQVLLGAVVLLA
jgi:hypothetical protein